MDRHAGNVIPRGILTILNRTDRKGVWDLPAHFRAVAILGDVRLDLRQARFLPGTSEIEVLLIFGQITITVPHGVRVESHDFKVKYRTRAVPREDAPCVRIVGTAMLGEVRVRVVDPND